MKINMVTEPKDQTWILRRWCIEWKKHIPNSTISESPDDKADINFYVNYALFDHKTSTDVCFFTHREKHDKNLQEKFDSSAQECDWCIAQSENTVKLLPKNKTTLVKPGIDDRFKKDALVLGIVGRDYESGRKRYHWLEKIREIQGVKVKTTKDNPIPYEEMPKFYQSIDYLVVLSDNEGGPMPVTEALGMGVPVIAPDVGWCWEYSVLRYETLDELIDLIEGLVIPKNDWEISSKQLMTVFKSLLNKQVETIL